MADRNIIGFTGDKGQIADLFRLPVCLFDDKPENIVSFQANTAHLLYAMPVRVENWRRGRVHQNPPVADWPDILDAWRAYHWQYS